MLRKLLKYEFRYNARIILPIFLGMLVLGAVGGVTVASCVKILQDLPARMSFFVALMNESGIFFGCVMLAVIGAASLFVMFVLLWRFYKSFYSDEAYLTHTLPVTVTQNMWCKTLSGFGWYLAGIIVAVVSYATAAFFAVVILGDIRQIIPFFEEVGNIFLTIPQQYAADAVIIGIEWIITGIVSIGYTILVYYAIIALGCRAARKHKVLATVGIYAAYSVISTIVTRLFLSAAVSVFAFAVQKDEKALRVLIHLLAPVTLIIFVLVSIGAWFIIRNCTEKHLNLE